MPRKHLKPKFTRLNIGCGNVKKGGFMNIDIAKNVNPDKVVDIEKGLPFPDNTFEHIFSSHALEEVRPEKWEFVLSEISRVARNNCVLELSLNFDNMYQRTRMNHYRTFSWDSFFVCEEGQECSYTTPIILRNLNKRPNVFVRLWFNLFPFLKGSIRFKFEIVKNKI
ncbi:MAG: class I SAM-dependent methyltransferase [archaeon]